MRIMKPEVRFSRPVYEALPWMYIICGLAALGASYLQTSSALSTLLGVPGFFALLAGIVILLRRRDYRQMRAQYEKPDALSDSDPTQQH
jgi:hypothetical protein